MRVTVVLNLDIDHTTWALEYGIDENDRDAIRKDVISWIENGAQSQLAELGLTA